MLILASLLFTLVSATPIARNNAGSTNPSSPSTTFYPKTANGSVTVQGVVASGQNFDSYFAIPYAQPRESSLWRDDSDTSYWREPMEGRATLPVQGWQHDQRHHLRPILHPDLPLWRQFAHS